MPTRLSRPRSTVLRAAPAGLPQRAGGAARAGGTAGPPAGGAGEVRPGGEDAIEAARLQHMHGRW